MSGQLGQKVDEMNFARGLKLHYLFFVFPFAFENGYSLNNFFALIIQGIGTL